MTVIDVSAILGQVNRVGYCNVVVVIIMLYYHITIPAFTSRHCILAGVVIRSSSLTLVICIKATTHRQTCHHSIRQSNCCRAPYKRGRHRKIRDFVYKLYCSVTEARACEQLAQGCLLPVSRPAEIRTRDLLGRERTLYR